MKKDIYEQDIIKKYESLPMVQQFRRMEELTEKKKKGIPLTENEEKEIKAIFRSMRG